MSDNHKRAGGRSYLREMDGLGGPVDDVLGIRSRFVDTVPLPLALAARALSVLPPADTLPLPLPVRSREVLSVLLPVLPLRPDAAAEVLERLVADDGL